MTERGILAFSGGLDTSVVVKYLQEEYDMDVITVTVDVTVMTSMSYSS